MEAGMSGPFPGSHGHMYGMSSIEHSTTGYISNDRLSVVCDTIFNTKLAACMLQGYTKTSLGPIL